MEWGKRSVGTFGDNGHRSPGVPMKRLERPIDFGATYETSLRDEL